MSRHDVASTWVAREIENSRAVVKSKRGKPAMFLWPTVFRSKWRTLTSPRHGFRKKGAGNSATRPLRALSPIARKRIRLSAASTWSIDDHRSTVATASSRQKRVPLQLNAGWALQPLGGRPAHPRHTTSKEHRATNPARE